MADYGVKVNGLNKVQKMLNKADANKALIVGLEWGMDELVKEMKYPPVSEANYPNEAGRWYQRGEGSKYMRKDGSVVTVPTSHPLKDAWKKKLFKGNSPKGVVSNSATIQAGSQKGRGYAVYVHGSRREKPGQAEIHTRRGWPSLPDEGKELAPKIAEKIIKAFKNRMKK